MPTKTTKKKLPVQRAKKTPRKAALTVPVVFALEAPQAGRVAVCGEFNDWSLEATPMQRLHGHRWEATLALRPGRYQYKFVADGQWLADPQASATVPDGHGAINSVIEVAGN